MKGIAEAFAGMSRAIDLRAYRHQVLASNIANADTPGYKARDFDFKTAMQKASAGSAGGGAMVLATTSGRHLGGGADAARPALQFRSAAQSAVDGNTVDMDVERAQIADNSMQYEILTRFISDRFQGIRTALSSNQS